MDVSTATVWEQVAAQLPDAVAVLDAGDPVTYRELDDRAGRLAAALSAAQIEAGDRVGVLLYNSSAYMETLFAAYKLSAIPVNLNFRYRGPELAYLIDNAGVSTVVYHPELEANILDAVRISGRDVPLIRVGGDGPRPDGVSELDDYRSGHEPVPHAVRPATDQMYLYTGGTTGNPKAVIWTLGDQFDSISYLTYTRAGRPVPTTVNEAVEIAAEMHRSSESPVIMPIAPLMHGTAISFATSSMCVGGTLVFTLDRSLDADNVWRTVERDRVSLIVIAGNAIATPLADALDARTEAGHPVDLSHVEVIASSGVPWSDDVKRRLLTHGDLNLFETLAASEGGPFAYASVDGDDDLPTRFVLAPEATVFDERGRHVEPGSDTIGMLAFRGSMPLGYLDDEQKTDAVYRTIDGVRWAMPGDYVQLREDRSIIFMGRGSSVVNTGGEKVYTAEVESTLLRHEAIRDCAVLGQPDPTWNEIVVAVVDSIDPDLTQEDVATYVGQQLASYKKPRKVVFTPAIPRGANGKIDPVALRTVAEREDH